MPLSGIEAGNGRGSQALEVSIADRPALQALMNVGT
jgi:hypothetical protein